MNYAVFDKFSPNSKPDTFNIFPQLLNPFSKPNSGSKEIVSDETYYIDTLK